MNNIIHDLADGNVFAPRRQVNILKYQIGLIGHFVWRDISLKYKGSILGILWSLVPPLSQLLVLAFVFGKVVPLNIDAFPAFVFSALLPWIWLGTSLGSASLLFLDNRGLVRSPDFPPYLLIIVNTLSTLVHYLLFLPILVLILGIYGRPFTTALVFFPLLLLTQFALITGVSLIIATLNVFYRDIQHVINAALMFLFYLTPVFYRTEGMNERYQTVFALNPIAALIQAYRDIFYYGTAPKYGAFLFVAFMSIVLFAIGYLVYARELHKVIDEV